MYIYSVLSTLIRFKQSNNSQCTCVCTVCIQLYMYSLGQLSIILCCSTMYTRLLIKMVKNHFKEDFNGVFKHLSGSGGNPVEDDMRSLLFGDYLVPDAVSRVQCVCSVHVLVLCVL